MCLSPLRTPATEKKPNLRSLDVRRRTKKGREGHAGRTCKVRGKEEEEDKTAPT